MKKQSKLRIEKNELIVMDAITLKKIAWKCSACGTNNKKHTLMAPYGAYMFCYNSSSVTINPMEFEDIKKSIEEPAIYWLNKDIYSIIKKYVE